MTKVLKGTLFKWIPKAQQAFDEIKEKLTQAPILGLPCFEKIFEIECNASGDGIEESSLKKASPLPTLVRSCVTPRESTLPMTKNFMQSFGHLSIGVTI